MPKLLHLQVACAENRVIGREGRLPWSIPEDLKFFHEQTAGQTVATARRPGAQQKLTNKPTG